MTKTLIGMFLVLLVSPAAFGQTAGEPNSSKIKEELRKLFSDLNEAISKRDRAALERTYADEFQFVHTTGGVVDKTNQINNILANDTPATVPTPTFEGVLVYGDLAILRTIERGVAGTNIYSKKGGRWQIVQVQGTRLPPERKPITIDPKALDPYLGKYEFAPGAYATVTKEGDVLMETWRQGEIDVVTFV